MPHSPQLQLTARKPELPSELIIGYFVAACVDWPPDHPPPCGGPSSTEAQQSGDDSQWAKRGESP